MRRSLTVLSTAAVSVLAASAVLAPPASASSKPQLTVIASHLSNPRGLAVAGDTVFVAESGRANDAHCLTDPTMGTTCAGLTGAVGAVDVDGGRYVRLATGLISVGGPGGIGTAGPSAVSVGGGRLYVVFGGNTTGIPPSGFPQATLNAAKAQLGQLARVRIGRVVPLAGVGDFDFAWTAEHKNLVPDQFPDSNPNGVLATGGDRYVADAGANTLTEVEPNGKIRVLAFFPAPKGSVTDTVPTCVTKGPDGALYVGELLGGSYAPGGARVWRVVLQGDRVVSKTVWARGFTTIQGCGFDRRGNFYATEFQIGGLNEDPTASPLGAVVKITPHGTRTVIGTGRLFWPSGLATSWDGSVFVSNCSIAPSTGFGPCPAGGQIIKISS